jgi:SAM-dependent methyltransferase
VFLAKLYLTQQCVVSGAHTAFYRRHDGSSTARAMKHGAYDPVKPNDSHENFLRWLSAHPLIQTTEANEELRELLAGALAAYEPAASTRRNARSVLVNAVPQRGRRLVRGAARRVRSLGPVRMGSLRRLQPLSRQFGFERGLPVDRYYIEQFLSENAHLISGRVLEVGDSSYTRRFGGGRVSQAEVLNIDPLLPETTIVADLASADHVPPSSFDCLVITQTLHLLYDISAAVDTLRRIVRPGGTVLATFPGISPISTDRWAGSWYWSLTPLSAARLFGDAFGSDNVEVRAFGNVLTSVAFLEGMAADELSRRELDVRDPQFPMLVTVRAYRPVTCES